MVGGRGGGGRWCGRCVVCGCVGCVCVWGLVARVWVWVACVCGLCVCGWVVCVWVGCVCGSRVCVASASEMAPLLHPRIFAGRGAGHSNLKNQLNRKNRIKSQLIFIIIMINIIIIVRRLMRNMGVHGWFNVLRPAHLEPGTHVSDHQLSHCENRYYSTECASTRRTDS